jgi:hypothetical protein
MTEAQWIEAVTVARREGDTWTLVDLVRVATTAR